MTQVATSGRFDEIFQTFEKTFPDICEIQDKSALVFCLTYDRKTKLSLFEVFSAHDKPGMGLSEIRFAPDFMYHDKVWFFFEQGSQLEAGVAYLADYRPKVYANIQTPLVSKSVPHFIPNCMAS